MNPSTKTFAIAILLAFITFANTHSQTTPTGTRDVYVDEGGVMRWGDTKKEVQGFGVNYTVPFAHAYRTAKKLGIDPKQAIDNDVYHFARLGFDLYRVHVWDTEISDTLGNLLENEYLEHFDYLLKKLSERGINYVVTPIAFWGNGWPEPDEKTSGFSHKYGKDGCLTDPGAIKAQENYLYQFLNHVNPYTGVAYKDDPRLIAFEISNEPHHRGAPGEVRDYINKMTASMRKTGCKKPIFYNVSHSIHLAEAYFDADIQGGTFQWYPTGLGFQKELQGNFMPNVDHYRIPFDDVIRENKGAKLVYEFDAADIGRSYIYPAMARSFREAGIQVATHFSYDPTYMAYANTEYNTHYMNLVYAPQKALSLMVCSEVFHRVPLYKSYGRYPDNARFDNFYLDYEKDLAEYRDDQKFIYTNSTSSKIENPGKLEQIAGYGNSEVVQYEGRGAYFLDKVEKGVWRLEVLPDVIWVDNLFGRNSLDRTLAVIQWNEWPMTVSLPDLGADFSIKGINEGNDHTPAVSGKRFAVKPGTYLLTKKDAKTKTKGTEKWKNIALNEFYAPKPTVSKTYVIHEPLPEITSGKDLVIRATIVAQNEPEEILVNYYVGWQPSTLKLERQSAYEYSATIPAEHLREGYFSYAILMKEKDGFHTYPSGVKGRPGDWDFKFPEDYKVKVVKKGEPVYLFDAHSDSDYLMRRWVAGSGMFPLAEPNKGEYVLSLEKLFEIDEENPDGEKIHDYSMKYYFRDKVAGRVEELEDKKKLLVKGRSLHDKPCKLQVAFTMKDGAAYGGMITLKPDRDDYVLNISDLKQVKFVTLPRPYPGFLPYYFENDSPRPFAFDNVESLQFSIGPGFSEAETEEKHGFAIESVRVE